MFHYFAYGSLMDLNFISSLGVKYKNPCSGILSGFDLRVNVKNISNERFGYANIISNSGFKVEGVLMEVPEEDFFLLDSYEGCPNLYSRIKMKIFSPKKQTYFTAWVYTGNSVYVVNQNLKLSKIQKSRIKNGFPFLSVKYQNNLKILMS